jgi:hypothetical protein
MIAQKTSGWEAVRKKIRHLLFVAALLTPLLFAFIRVRTAPTVMRLFYSGILSSKCYVYYQRESDNDYSEERICSGMYAKNEISFVLPGDAVFARSRLDLGDKRMILDITGIKVSRNFFWEAELSPALIRDCYAPNKYVSWALAKNGWLHVETAPPDPFVLPDAGKLTQVLRSSHFSVQRLWVFLKYALLWYLAVFLVFCWDPIAKWYQKWIKPFQWYWAVPVFVGCFFVVYPFYDEENKLPGGKWVVIFFLLFFTLCHLGEYVQKKLEAKKNPDNQPVRKKLKMDMTMVYFRAFAILSIVLGHYLIVLLWYPTPFPSWMKRFVVAFFADDSIYFLFISGYLFYYLTDRFTVRWEGLKCIKESGKFKLPVFYRKKITNVLLPYVIVSILATAYMIATGNTSGLVGSSITWSQLPLRIINGTVQGQFWYIPYILCVFLFVPLLLLLPHRIFYAILIPAFACIIAVNRPAVMMSAEGFLCFVPAFLFGMYYALEREKLFNFFKAHFWYFLAASLICSCCLFNYGYLKSLTALHKLFTIPVVIVLLSYIEDRKYNVLIMIANLSFTLYFLHMLFVQHLAISITGDMRILGISSFVIICFMRTFLTFVYLFVLSWSLKVLTGKYSRMLIGA